MATVGAALTSEKNTSRLSYITVAAFNTAIYTYTQTTTNYVTTGTLAANVINPLTGVTVTAGDCPAGRVLRETGRKLYATSAYPGVTTYMVSVYDSVLGVNGFIDPNSTLFAIYNVDKPNFIDADLDEQTALGPPIYTGGVVTAGGLAISPKYSPAMLGGATSSSTAGVVTLVLGIATVTTSAALTTSLIFLTNVAFGTAAGVLSVARANGSFTITSTNLTETSTIAWLIIN